jgi:hypothetical protein
MKNIKLGMIILAATVLIGGLGAYAQSDRSTPSQKVELKAGSVQSEFTLEQKQSQRQPTPAAVEAKARHESLPERSGSSAPVLGYLMVTGSVSAFGGESESNNYVNPASSGGQPSAIGISQSTNYELGAGLLHALSIVRGDASANGQVDLGDAIYILNYLFKGDQAPCPVEAGDANCDGGVSLGDSIFLLNYLFKGGPAPAC